MCHNASVFFLLCDGCFFFFAQNNSILFLVWIDIPRKHAGLDRTILDKLPIQILKAFSMLDFRKSDRHPHGAKNVAFGSRGKKRISYLPQCYKMVINLLEPSANSR